MVSSLHIMSYLRIRNNSCLVLDPSYADINLSEFKSDNNWTDFYRNSKEANTHNALNLLVSKLSSEYLSIMTMSGIKRVVIPVLVI